MSISEIRTMKDKEALFVYANKKPLKMKIKPYYKKRLYDKVSKLKPYTGQINSEKDCIDYIDSN
jgi:type IV secretory pathway TraG/TraD family ATPase VirD4